MQANVVLRPEGIAVVVIITYWACVEALKSRGILERFNLDSYGPIIIIRTRKGLKLLEKISKPKRLWRVLANLGIPAVFAGMGFMFALIILMDIVMVKSPPPPSPVTSPRNVLLIPWVNTLFPPIYLLIGLIFTLIVHEFSHAILCRVEDVKVKALGLITLLVPIGGFAEPDEEELTSKTTRMQRVRIFSAGVISNFSLACISFVLFMFLLGFLQPTVFVAYSGNTTLHTGDVVKSINGINVSTDSDVNKALLLSFKLPPGKGKIIITTENGTYQLPNVAGVKIFSLYNNYPAQKAGLKPGMVIYRVNDTYTPTLTAFEDFMSKTRPNETLRLFVFYKNKTEVFNVTLTKSPYSSSGFLGVRVYEVVGGLQLGYSSMLLKELKGIPSQLKSVRGWVFVVAMPLMGFKGFTGQTTKYFKPKILGSNLFKLLTALYWIGWVDFYVGLFNCLPAIPLDGGRVFYEFSAWALEKRLGEKGDKIAENIVKYLAYLIFASLIMSVVIPNLAYFKWHFL